MTPTRSLLLLVSVLAGTVGVGLIACKLAGIDPHGREMMMAVAIALFSGQIGILPASSQQKKKGDTAAMFQAALLGSVMHLGLVFVLAVGAMLAGRADKPFVFWLLGAYWATLAALCFVFAKLIKAAPVPGKPQ